MWLFIPITVISTLLPYHLNEKYLISAHKFDLLSVKELKKGKGKGYKTIAKAMKVPKS